MLFNFTSVLISSVVSFRTKLLLSLSLVLTCIFLNPVRAQFPPNAAAMMALQGASGATGLGNPGAMNSANAAAIAAAKGSFPTNNMNPMMGAPGSTNQNSLNRPSMPKLSDAMPKAEEVEAPPNTFQTYLLQSTGKKLPIFGQNLFNLNNPYADIESSNVPSDYVLGPGDELQVKIYSPAIDLDQRFVINRDGMIVLPRLGPISLAGTRVSDLETRLKNTLSQSLSDFNLYVSMGQLRGIEVYVTGQAKMPGKHNLSSVSTLINALFATGGPSSNGTMRNIQLLRNGKVVAKIDLYQFLAKGDKGNDVRLLPGDVINIPSIGEQVGLRGTIPMEAVFELSNIKRDSIKEILQIAGGMTAFTRSHEVLLERIEKNILAPVVVATINMDSAQGMGTLLKDGDVLTFYPIKPNFSNAVSLRILNSPIVRVPIKVGAKVTDVIPDKRSLLTADYFYRRFNVSPTAPGQTNYGAPTAPGQTSSSALNSLGQTSGEIGTDDDFNRIRLNALLDQINFEQVIIERINQVTLKPELISFHLGKAIENPSSADNVVIQAGDTITVFSQRDIRVPLERQTRVVRLQGEVNAPGIYQVKGGETIQDLLAKAGGLTQDAYLFGMELVRPSVRETQKKNIESLVKRMEDQSNLQLQEQLGNINNSNPQTQALAVQNQQRIREKIAQIRTSVPSGRIALELDPRRIRLPDLALENGDEILIPFTPSIVSAIGAVYNENGLIYKSGRVLEEYVKVAGLTQFAEPELTFVVRADGSIVAPDSNAFLFKGKINRLEIMPGDTIVVPDRVIRESGYSAFMRNFKDLTQVFFQLGLGAASVKVLRQ